MSYSVSLSGLQSTLNRLKDANKDIQTEVDAAIGRGVRDMDKMANRLAPVDKGFLRAKISALKVSDLTWVLVAQSDYAAFMEFGTKGYVDVPAGLEQYANKFRGKGNKGNRKLKEVIYDWCKRKGIPKEKWWFVYKQIAEKGVKPHPFFFPSVFAYRPQIVKNIVKILKKKR
jgi:hypothetical protein